MDLPSGAGPFPELPGRQAKLLLRAGFRTPIEVRRTTDDEILLAKGISKWTLAVIRSVYPYVDAPPTPLMICPCCGGMGRVRRFNYDPPAHKR